jgi:hypothetical protein
MRYAQDKQGREIAQYLTYVAVFPFVASRVGPEGDVP